MRTQPSGAGTKVVDVPVYADTFDAVTNGETVEIERYDGRVTKLVRNGTEATLPERIRTAPSKGKLRAAFAFLLLESVGLVVETLRARKREPAKLAWDGADELSRPE